MTAGRLPRPRMSAVGVVAVGAGVAAFLAAVWFVRPWQALVGSDAASSVLYWERLVRGETLERFLGTTPKPLLTVLYGLAHDLTGGWAAVSWIGVATYAAAIALSALLVGRLAGAGPAAFAATGLVANRFLTQDVMLAYAVSASVLAVAAAGWLLTLKRPRWVLAGGLLAVGALARQEVILVVAVAAVTLGWWWLRARRRGPTIDRRAWWLLLGLVALPIAGLHDWLLTGDPLYWVRVPAIGTETRVARELDDAIPFVLRHLWAQAPFVLLAALGTFHLVTHRRWPIVVGLVALGPGVAAFFVVAAARGLVTLDRYLALMDVAIVIAAASGTAATRIPALERLLPRRTAPAFVVAALVLAALALAPTVGPLDRDLTARARAERVAHADWRALRATVLGELASMDGVRVPPRNPDPFSRQSEPPLVLVSARLLPLAAVDLDLRLDRIRPLETLVAAPGDLASFSGSLIYHAAGVDISRDALVWLQVDAEVVLDGARIVPIQVHAARVWLLRTVKE